jgi:hypothetical protein
MYRILAIALAATIVAGPSLAETTCSNASPAKFQPEATLKQQLKTEGLDVRQIKVESGCYEVYAVDANGNKVNVAFNAETLEKVGNAEAGEN